MNVIVFGTELQHPCRAFSAVRLTRLEDVSAVSVKIRAAFLAERRSLAGSVISAFHFVQCFSSSQQIHGSELQGHGREI